MKYKFILHFISSCLCAFLVGLLLWSVRELIATFDTIWQLQLASFVFNYEHYMYIIIFLGVPLGSVLGLLFVDKLILKLPEWNVKGILRDFLCSFLGMVLLGLTRYWAEGCEDGPIVFFIRGDRFILVILIVAGFLATLGHSISFRYKKKT